jgi:two-component system LytT family sensor kinase
MITAFRTSIEFLFWKLIADFPAKEMMFKWGYTWNNLRLVIITGIYAILIRFTINWFESQKLKHELINRQQASELALLRSRINPHFLFNTLNNIYSLVYRKSDEAPAAVMKLSSIMRYMLSDVSTRKVLLEKEVEYLHSFIELQKLRIKDPDFVSFEIDGEPERQSIEPMLLIPFVENAFRYGSRKHSPGIVIRLSVTRKIIRFEVLNYLKKTTAMHDEYGSRSDLVNIRRRLELIYPGKHSLVITEDAETYRIILEINN